MQKNIAVIGECMIEVKPHASIGYGGDTLNFSTYLARLGVAVSYVTALGDDPMSDSMVDAWQQEGIDCTLVARQKGSLPGLYLIDVDDTGERSFYYWRSKSPARAIFDDEAAANTLFEALGDFKYLYLSGITLAIYNAAARQRLFDFLDDFRDRGGLVIFDNNYRARQWQDVGEARAVFEAMYRRSDIALPTIDDEQELFGKCDEPAVIERLQSWGIPKIVLKKGPEGCVIATGENKEHVAASPVDFVVDTTAAGDSFNAGFIAAMFAGKSIRQAAVFGGALAARVVQHRGAIIQRDAMKDFTL